MVFGYARVSTKQQNEDRQLAALKEYGVADNCIYIDKESGKNLQREQYQILRNAILREGDTLVIKELDRLSRNKSDIKAELEYYQQMKIKVVILDIPTTKITYENENKWVGDMITAVLIEVLSSMAEQERLKIRKRQAEGIAIAKKQGKKFGRPKVNKPPNWNNVIIALDRGEITAVEAMKKLRLKKTSFYKLKNADKNAEME
ncbi:recombinase family protein [Ruminococcus sp. CAG:57]|uniref:recombinase family protein n=1 Tax=Ruminococcus sp. CAG:57 TaxID=1262962 RepID=UPI00033767EA|nr:recombinase family protein [Ruminococcus sp. CAG:57]CDC64912.1 putative uncharacterized protein [Ruminococcus sp. CAG:57]